MGLTAKIHLLINTEESENTYKIHPCTTNKIYIKCKTIIIMC